METIKFIKNRLESLYKEKESLTTDLRNLKIKEINTVNILIKEYEDILNDKQLMRELK